MRPIANIPSVGDTWHGACDGLATPQSSTHMSCFITTEAALDTASNASGPDPTPRFHPTCARRKRSLESSSRSACSRLPSPVPTTAGDSVASLSSSALDFDLAPSTPHLSAHSPLVASGLSGSVSAISSASSRRNSMTASSPSRTRERSPAVSSDGHARRDIPPQFIMPSLAVPQRRPFSETGKSIGKLKLMVAGASGIGKSSLIRSIARCCEHIVHMDPIPPSKPGVCNEIYASTRPRPWWRSDSDASSFGRSRKSLSSEMVDRNLCFVDSSVSRSHSAFLAESNYIDSQLFPLLDKAMDDKDLWSLVSSGGEPIVDGVLYLVSHTGLEPVDIECIRVLQEKTNVIPLLARCDELDDEEALLSAKERLVQSIEKNGLECFSFNSSGHTPASSAIMAVSNATEADHDQVDASILMSSGYVEPLVHTDLDRLVELVFSLEGSSWLRHSAATKCVRWRREHGGGRTLQQALTLRDPSAQALSRVLAANPFVQRGHWEQIEISNWAQCLRHSLEAERLRTTALQRMTANAYREGLVTDLVRHGGKSKRKRNGQETANLTHQDPLGLLHLASHMRRNGQFTVEVLTSVGVLGCVGVWLAGPDWANSQGLRRLPWDVVGWCLP